MEITIESRCEQSKNNISQTACKKDGKTDMPVFYLFYKEMKSGRAGENYFSMGIIDKALRE